MEEKTGKEIKFDIDIEELDIMEDTIEEGSKIFPIKEQITLEVKEIKYDKNFIKSLEIMQKLKRNKKIKRLLERKDKAIVIVKFANKKRKGDK
jgi:hypothetical protein|nr:MAG TPA: hypothetical protein [Caudoviricetes sp.]